MEIMDKRRFTNYDCDAVAPLTFLPTDVPSTQICVICNGMAIAEDAFVCNG